MKHVVHGQFLFASTIRVVLLRYSGEGLLPVTNNCCRYFISTLHLLVNLVDQNLNAVHHSPVRHDASATTTLEVWSPCPWSARSAWARCSFRSSHWTRQRQSLSGEHSPGRRALRLSIKRRGLKYACSGKGYPSPACERASRASSSPERRRFSSATPPLACRVRG